MPLCLCYNTFSPLVGLPDFSGEARSMMGSSPLKDPLNLLSCCSKLPCFRDRTLPSSEVKGGVTQFWGKGWSCPNCVIHGVCYIYVFMVYVGHMRGGCMHHHMVPCWSQRKTLSVSLPYALERESLNKKLDFSARLADHWDLSSP